MAASVQAPDGRTWLVRRRFVPRLGAESVWGRFHRRFKQTFRRAGDAADVDPGCLEVLGEGLLAALFILVAVAVLAFVLIPVLVAIVDVLLLCLLALLGLAGRVVFRRPWTVEARAGDGECLVWRVVGWRASGDHVSRVAELLEAGIPPPGGLPTTSEAKAQAKAEVKAKAEGKAKAEREAPT